MIQITPTIGRRIWYRPSAQDLDLGMTQIDAAQALDAGIVFVHDDETVNLSIVDHVGTQFARHGVKITEVAVEGEAFAQWMPYQVSGVAVTSAWSARPSWKTPAEAAWPATASTATEDGPTASAYIPNADPLEPGVDHV